MPTVAKAAFGSYGVREGRFYEWLVSVLQMHILDVSFGSTENYATGGIDIATGIRKELDIQEIHGLAVLWHNVGGWLALYNPSTGKLQFFGTAGAAGALAEMANGSTAINGKTVRILVIGS